MAPSVFGAALLAAAATLLLLCLEWLFFVTKPSMFSVMSWPQRVAVLAASALPAMLVAAACASLLALLGKVVSAPSKRSSWLATLGLLVPALILAATTLLLVENFTLAVAGFNLGRFKSPLRYLYAAGCLGLVVFFGHRLRRSATGSGMGRRRRAGAIGLTGALAILATVSGFRYQPQPQTAGVSRTSDQPLTNVLVLSSDGIAADQMSLYGYERETTPFLESRAAEFLVSDNHVSNSALTAGSTGSLLSGKLPTTTGVTQQFRVFQDRDVYEHLPGVLRQLGYYGIEIGARHYADSHDQNMRLGFHVSNNRKLTSDSVALLNWYGLRYPSERHFLASVAERVRERVAHAFGLEDMAEPVLAPEQVQPQWTSDELRIAALKKEIDRAPRPFFAHVHLLDTHGPMFRPRRSHFSRDREQLSGWDRDFFDDAVLGFDSYIEEMVRHLEASGELDNTILIVNTDHGARSPEWPGAWDGSQRLPLLIRFPRSEHRGRIVQTTQRIDVAPTILSYLGVAPPPWMEGQSILDPLERLRLIFSTSESFQQSSFVSLVQCQRGFQLHPGTGDVVETTLEGHTDPCPESELIGPEESRAQIIARLSESRYLTVPLMLGGKLFRLRTDNDPEMRRQITQAIRDRPVEARWLDDEIAIAWSHWDLWTYGSSPAALVVVNRSDEALTRRLTVHSDQRHEFPFSFYVEDGTETHEFTFASYGTMLVELAPVPPAGERLFVIWSDQAFQAGARQVGVQLAANFGDQLTKLARRQDSRERRRLARAILEGEVESAGLEEDVRVAGAFWDFWSRGDQPAAIVVSNKGRRPVAKRIAVRSGPKREFPLSFYVEDGDTTEEYVFERPGTKLVELPRVAPGRERLFTVWTDRPWRPESGDRRVLGIRLAAVADSGAAKP